MSREFIAIRGIPVDEEVRMHIEEGERMFDDFLGRMSDLMREAREVEFRIRLAAEADAHRAVIDESDFVEFSESKFHYPRKKLHKHIADVFPKGERLRISLAQEIANQLAHADYRPARVKIEQYQDDFGLKATLGSDPVGLYYYKDVIDDSGAPINIGYLLESHDHNLTIEEYHVFDRQGYAVAAREIFSTAIDLLETRSHIGFTYHMVMWQRGLKRGKRIPRGDSLEDA